MYIPLSDVLMYLRDRIFTKILLIYVGKYCIIGNPVITYDIINFY